MATLKKTIVALFVVSCVASYCLAQTQNAVVKRNTYLRQGPSTSDQKIILLKPDDELELLEPNATNSYYHVRTLDADEGYAYSKNITVQESSQSLTTDLAAPSGQVADTIAASWEKPDPKKITFTGVDGNCPWNGDDSDPDTFARKTRTDTPENDGIEYHDVKWSAIAQLPYPVAKPLRKDWTLGQLAEIAPYEGIAVRTVGYLVAYKPQNHGSGEIPTVTSPKPPRPIPTWLWFRMLEAPKRPQ